MEKLLLAKENGTTVVEHCIETGKVAMQLAKNVSDDTEFINNVTLLACLHDIGKATKGFQDHLKNGTSQEILHNVVSAIFLTHFLPSENFKYNESTRRNGILSILYHHPCDVPESLSLDDIDDDDINTISEIVKEISSEYKSITGNEIILSKNRSNSIGIPTQFSPDSSRRDNEEFIKFSSIIKTADIIASSGIEIDTYIGLGKKVTEFSLPEGYDKERFEKQVDFAKSITGHKVSHITAPAGFGKTLIATMWGLMNGRKTWWVVPRNVIARSTYNSVKKEIENLGLKDINVGLLLTGKWEQGDYNSNIIITNIDNIARPAINSDKNYMNYNIINDNVVFDEYQEYLTENGSLMAIFLVLAKARMELNKCGETLFMSATDAPMLIDDITKQCRNDLVRRDDCGTKMLDSKRQIFFADEMPLKTYKSTSTFVYRNSVSDCQDLYTKGYCDRIFHSNYVDEDRQKIEEALYKEHGKGGDANTSWVATNILSTGLDVSFDNIVIASPTPDRTIQINGRGGRWNTNDKIIPCTFIKPDDKCKSDRMAIETFYTFELAKNWYDFLKANIENESIIPLRTLYELRKQFMAEPRINEKLKTFYKRSKKESFLNLSHLQYLKSSSKDEDNVKYIGRQSIRRDNDYQEFYCRVKYEGENTYTPAFTTDTLRMRIDSIRTEECIKGAIFYLDKSGEWTSYKSNKYQWEGFKKKDVFKQFDFFMDAARCSGTPLVISKNYVYNRVIGLKKC